MIENIKYATISQIYVKDLKFYNEDNKQDLISLCSELGITFIPDKDRSSIYKLVDSNFVKSELIEDLKCNPYDRIFDLETLYKFEKGNHDEVLFVMDNNKIKGVVHIVDYNNEFIYFEFYKLIFHFEKNLRDLLRKNNESNDNLIEWMLQKSTSSSSATSKEFWKKRYEQCIPIDSKKRDLLVKKRRECSPFQTFYLNDLLHYSCSKEYISSEIKKNIDSINKVRNWVAHNQEIISKNESKIEIPLYNIDGLKKFVTNANIFFEAYEEVEAKLKE
jgi:hypothetical protein